MRKTLQQDGAPLHWKIVSEHQMGSNRDYEFVVDADHGTFHTQDTIRVMAFEKRDNGGPAVNINDFESVRR